MKRSLSLILTGAMAMSLAACSSSSSAPAAEPEKEKISGTFEGSAQGFHGTIEATVDIEDSKICGVGFTGWPDTYGVSDYAMKEMPERIIDANSWNVDVCTGSTFSSIGIKNAVKNALENAGIEGFDEKVSMTAENETIDCDVVIVGAGIAGISAAVEAAKTGADVVLLEKLDRIGGSSVTSGGIVVALASEMNKEANAGDSVEEWVDYYAMRGNENVDREMLKFWAENSSDTLNWLTDEMGVEFHTVGTSGLSLRERAHTNGAGGGGIIMPMEEALLEYDNINLIRHCTVTSVKTNDDGSAAGVTADHYGAEVNVNAKAVILTAGGYDASDEMRAKYSPESAESYCMSSCGNTGDWIAWGNDIGAQMEFKGGVMGMHTTNPYYTLTDGINLYSFLGTLGVNAKGERFQNELNDYPVYDTQMKKDGSDHFWHIYTTEILAMYDAYGYGSTDTFEANIETGYVVKADTIEDLAKAAGMDPVTLTATVDRYNKMAQEGVDEDYGCGNMMPITTDGGSYYAVKVVKATVASFGGFVINEKSELLNADGTPIKGFYAAGEDANAVFLEMEYPASGSMLSISTTFGRIAGQEAAALAGK